MTTAPVRSALIHFRDELRTRRQARPPAEKARR